MEKVNFGEKLKKLRTEAGYTQADLAKRLNISKAVVSYYELQERTPSPDVLIRLADIFRVSSDYLLGISHTKIIDVSNLSDEDMRLVLLLVKRLEEAKK